MRKFTRKHEVELYNRVFREDGTLRGTTFVDMKTKGGQFYQHLRVQLDTTTYRPIRHSLSVHDDFYVRFAEVVDILAVYHGISVNSRIYHDMLDSADKYLRRYGLCCDVQRRMVEFQTLKKAPSYRTKVR